MKSLYFDVTFDSDYKLFWEIAPVGTETNYGAYDYHYYRSDIVDNDVPQIISSFKRVLNAFKDNIVDKGYNDFVYNVVDKALNSDWDNGFHIEDSKGDDIKADIKLRVIEDNGAKSYLFCLTKEQQDDLNCIAQDIGDYDDICSYETRDAVMKTLISTYFKWQADEINRKDDWDD